MEKYQLENYWINVTCNSIISICSLFFTKTLYIKNNKKSGFPSFYKRGSCLYIYIFIHVYITLLINTLKITKLASPRFTNVIRVYITLFLNALNLCRIFLRFYTPFLYPLLASDPDAMKNNTANILDMRNSLFLSLSPYSLLFGSTNDVTSHLQRIQNYAARVIFRLPMSSSITIHLKSLHWLPVKVRSTYKIACLCYHCHSSTAPSYVTDMLHKKPLHTRNTRSSSYTMPLLNRPAHSKATLGDRSFSFASSSVWNSIPNDVRCAPSLSSFKSRLKTYLFRSVYID